MSSGPLVVSLDVSLDADEGRDGFLHRWAGLELWSSRALEPGALPAVRPEAARLEPADDWKSVIELEAGAPAAPRSVLRAGRGAARFRVDYDDESYLVAVDGSAIVRSSHAEAGEALVLERLLGAPLALALALRGTYLLHASAVSRDAGAIALTAPSGGGKSTLAAAAATRGGGWRRLADDILPVHLGAAPMALPHFPQLKLPPRQLYPSDAPPQLPLAALVVLDRRGEGEALELERLSPAAAALALAEATVASRLFDDELLAAHLAACAAAATVLRVMRLRFPSGLDRLGDVLDRVADASR